jgi:UDP-3-O-[3-hydroxymyristoyl] glucosamine N-acyltransferase
VVDATAVIDPSASIGPLCVVERGAHIGAGTVLKSRVTVGEDCRIGARCLLHSGVVIGADGFGFAQHQGAWVKIEQLGAVRIGDDVEIGANTCVDRGALQDTVIEDGVKLDNLVQIGHNVRVGRHSAMAGCVGVAGSAQIGAHCTLGGGAIVLGHLVMADNVHISAATVVTRSLTRPGHYTGMFPIDDNARWEKNAATLKQLHSLRERIKALEQSLKAV